MDVDVTMDENNQVNPNTSSSSTLSSEIHKASTKRPVPVASDEESRKRGRRMLGVVLGTLQKFRTTEQSDPAADKQRQVQARLSERLQEEKQLLTETLERERQERREKRETARAAWMAKEEVEVRVRRQDLDRSLSRFLKTMDTSVHSVFYLPSRLTGEQEAGLQRRMADTGLDPRDPPGPEEEEEPLRRLDFDLDHDSYDDMSTDDEYRQSNKV